ncbi:MAG: hypothetical protein K1Y01_10470 [Vicinamibacteria bacterium]|nr:hypothetical protein [Vicinamibacteria bacterium]
MVTKRVGALLVVLLACAGGLKYKVFRDEQSRAAQQSRTKFVPPPKVVRQWLWPDESVATVHQVIRQIVSWSLQAGGPAPTIAVRRQANSKLPGVFEVTLRGASTTTMDVGPGTHLWDPESYVAAATRLLGSGEAVPGPPVPGFGALLLTSDTASLLEANRLLFSALAARPRDPRLHEQAALLWAAHALRESARGRVDPIPFLNGVVAHLAISRALKNGAAPGPEAVVASLALDVLLQRQTVAMTAVQRLLSDSRESENRAWANALRVRMTSDPRLDPGSTPPTRLEKLEYLIALRATRRDCGVVIPTAKSWRVPPAADWARESLRCFDEEYLARVGNPMALQAEDAARLAEVEGQSVEEVVKGLVALSQANTQQPAVPSAVVPREIRAEAGLRHVAGAYELVMDGIASRRWTGATDRFRDASEAFRPLLPQAALLDLTPDARDPSVGQRAQAACIGAGKIVQTRPDFLSDNDWTNLTQCFGMPALRGVQGRAWDRVNVPGTGLIAPGPWHTGFPWGTPEFDQGLEMAPWNPNSAYMIAQRKTPVGTFVDPRSALARFLDYDVNVMIRVLPDVEDPLEAEKIAQRACAMEADSCAEAGRFLSIAGRYDAAIPLGRRAVESAHGQIGLSQSMSWYVSLLQERGRIPEAMGLAERMAQVYSQGGLETLAKAYERLGDFVKAEENYRLVFERYGRRDTLDRFYVRHAQRYGAAPFQDETAKATNRIFPKGIRRVGLPQAASIARPVSLASRALLDLGLRTAGLTRNDYVVAVDGIAVETEEQYGAAIGFSDDPDMQLLVRRADRKFEEVTVRYYRSHYDIVGKRKTPA